MSFLQKYSFFSIFLSVLYSPYSFSQMVQINGSPFATDGAPLPMQIKTQEKTILIDPKNHFYGAYNPNGKLVRWGIATTGSKRCAETNERCDTSSGMFRIYSVGNENCYSKKYDGAQMPYCMYFKGGQAIHGSNDIQSANISHGCVRVHIDDAKWLRYHFVIGPNNMNQYKGTKVVILPY